MKRNLNLETSRNHSSTSLPPPRATRTAATHSLATRFRRRLGRVPSVLLALLGLALTVPVREASADGPPIVTTLDATGVFDGGATLNGYWDPNGDPMALAWFEWSGGSTRPFTWGGYVSTEVGMAHGDPLMAGTTYYFQLVAANQWGTAYGGEMSFTTPGGVQPPTVVTLPATDVTSSSATLNGGVDPNGANAWFEWGTSTAYGNSISLTPTVSGTISAPLAWLTSDTTYHFRAAAAGGLGFSVYGDDQSFTTLPGPVQPQFTFTTNNGTITITGYYGPVAMTIPSTITGLPVTRIGDSAFYYYSSLTSVTIPDSVIDIGDNAFEGCRGLTNVTMGNCVTSIGAGAFWDCFSLTNVTIPDSVTCIRDHAFYYCTSLTNVTMGNGVTNIGVQAFDDCSSLTRITIPDSVTSIGDDSFLYCTRLTNVTIGKGLTSIGDHVLNYCTSLTTITVDALNPSFCSVDGILFDKTQTTLIQCPERKAGSYTIPDSVTSIGNDAFFECTSLTDVTIDNSATSIGDHAFYYCTSLTGVAIPNTVTSIGDYAFRECSSLTKVTIGNGVTSIGQEAFTFCSRLTNLTIGNSVASIGDNAFNGCTSLTALNFGGNAPSIGSDVFDGDSKATVYYLPGTAGWGTTFGGLPTALWQSPPPSAWTLSASAITPTGATLNGTVNPNGYPATAWFQWGATSNYGNLTSATGMGSGTSALPLSAPLAGLAPGITYHYRVAATNGNGAVYGSDQSFTTLPGPVQPQFTFTTNNGTITITGYYGPVAVTIPSTITGLPVTSIGDRAFYQCTNLTSITIPDSVISIGQAVFCYCWSLTSVTIPDGVTSIADHAFYDCTNLTNLTIPTSGTSIGDSAFAFCSSLTNLAIPDSVTRLGDKVFWDCTNLTALYFIGNAPSLGGAYVFYGDNNATIYYLLGTTGWGTTFGGLPTALWFLPHPLILTSGPGFGVQSNAFGFIISWATNLPVVVEACANLANPIWAPVRTNTLIGGAAYFSDPQWTNYPGRFYRLRWP